MMGRCMENNTQAFIQDKRHMTKLYVTLYHYFSLQMPGSFLHEQTKYLKFRLQLLTGVQIIDSQSN